MNKKQQKRRDEAVERFVQAFNGKTFSSHEDYTEKLKRLLSAMYFEGYTDSELYDHEE